MFQICSNISLSLFLRGLEFVKDDVSFKGKSNPSQKMKKI